MLHPDVGYTNGVIAAREKYLLKDKLLRLCELNAQDAFRALVESGFGGGAETATEVHEYEKLVAEEERRLDEFIDTYAPTAAERAYLLAPRDFHNAKAIVKAAYLQTDAERMLAPQGEIEIGLILSAVESRNVEALRPYNPILASAIEKALAFEETPSGLEIGVIFEKATYAYLFERAKKNKILKNLLQAKADMTNILTALRSADKDEAERSYVFEGSLKKATLETLFLEDREKIEFSFAATPYVSFLKKCLDAKSQGLPLTEGERIRDSYDTAYFEKRKYELEKTEPFLYYVYRRKAENANVRIIFVCLLAGMTEAEVKKRLRNL